MTAAAARKAASRSLADILASDPSEYALCPGNESRLRAMIAETGDTRDEGIPINTAKSDEWGFKWVRAFFEDTGGPWMRPRVIGDHLAMEREKFAFAWCLCWIASHMKPAARTAAKNSTGSQPGKIAAAKPGSALQAVIAYRRVQRDCGRELVPMQGVSKVLRGLLRRYQTLFGDRALVPIRAEPFSQAHLLALIRGCTTLAIPAWSTTMHAAMHTANLYSLATGARKDEWTKKAPGDACIKRANFEWLDKQGSPLPDTEATLETRRNGSMLRGYPGASKCDQLAVEWGSKPMWFRYDDTNPLNFASQWCRWERQHPCPGHLRDAWPALSPKGNEEHFTPAAASEALTTLMIACIGAEAAARRAWHGHRVTLATALLAKRSPDGSQANGDGTIQAHVRWKTAESMRIYARLLPNEYADRVEEASRTDVALGLQD